MRYNRPNATLRMETLPGPWSESEARLCKNIEALMDLYRWTQTDFAAKLGRSQSWVSKRMSKKPEANKWKVEDLDAIAQVFEVTAYDLLRPGHGQLDRRSLHARRTHQDRRAAYSQGVTGVAPPRLDAVAATDHAIIAANRLFELAESLHAAADAILRRHAATVSDLPPERLGVAGELGESTGGTSTKKTG